MIMMLRYYAILNYVVIILGRRRTLLPWLREGGGRDHSNDYHGGSYYCAIMRDGASMEAIECEEWGHCAAAKRGRRVTKLAGGWQFWRDRD